MTKSSKVLFSERMKANSELRLSPALRSTLRHGAKKVVQVHSTESRWLCLYLKFCSFLSVVAGRPAGGRTHSRGSIVSVHSCVRNSFEELFDFLLLCFGKELLELSTLAVVEHYPGWSQCLSWAAKSGASVGSLSVIKSERFALGQ